MVFDFCMLQTKPYGQVTGDKQVLWLLCSHLVVLHSTNYDSPAGAVAYMGLLGLLTSGNPGFNSLHPVPSGATRLYLVFQKYLPWKKGAQGTLCMTTKAQKWHKKCLNKGLPEEVSHILCTPRSWEAQALRPKATQSNYQIMRLYYECVWWITLAKNQVESGWLPYSNDCWSWSMTNDEEQSGVERSLDNDSYILVTTPVLERVDFIIFWDELTL